MGVIPAPWQARSKHAAPLPAVAAWQHGSQRARGVLAASKKYNKIRQTAEFSGDAVLPWPGPPPAARGWLAPCWHRAQRQPGVSPAPGRGVLRGVRGPGPGVDVGSQALATATRVPAGHAAPRRATPRLATRGTAPLYTPLSPAGRGGRGSGRSGRRRPVHPPRAPRVDKAAPPRQATASAFTCHATKPRLGQRAASDWLRRRLTPRDTLAALGGPRLHPWRPLARPDTWHSPPCRWARPRQPHASYARASSRPGAELGPWARRGGGLRGAVPLLPGG